ncbi:heat shock protein Hsp20 [Streptococcus infantarius subsp. infantarius]|nr:heat shock protein Hsp20 [Streptococcus infantarius subsp. infantarius]
MPGVDKKDINLQLNDGKLTISITRDEINETQEKNYIHKERRYNSMSRSIYLEDSKPYAARCRAA